MDRPFHAYCLCTTQFLFPCLIELSNNFLCFLLMQKEAILTLRILTVMFISVLCLWTTSLWGNSSTLPWVFLWSPRWLGCRCDRGGCWWRQHGWTGPKVREMGSFLSLHWSLWRDHPFDWQPGDYSQSSCNRTGLPERGGVEEEDDQKKDRR